MNRKPFFVVAALLLVLFLTPMSGLRAQDFEGADLEVLDPAFNPSTDPAPTATAEAWPVCQNGHWIRSAPGYPEVCTREHIDALYGPLGPCSIIVVNKVKYHILRVQKTDRGWIITVVKV